MLFRKPGGHGQVIGPAGTVKLGFGNVHRGDMSDRGAEFDTFTCYHCNTVVNVPHKADPSNIGGLCKVCMKLICPKCVGKKCVPFERQLMIWEMREEALRSYGMTEKPRRRVRVR